MPALPLRWQGRRRSEQLRGVIGDRCAIWRQGWAVGLASDCDLALIQHDAPLLTRAGERWFDASSDAGHLYLKTAGNSVASLGAQLLGLEASGSSGLAERIGRRALVDLVCGLATIGTVTPQVESFDHRQDTVLSARHGFLSLAWRFGAVRAELHLDAALCDALLPRTSVDAPSLFSRYEAVRDESLALDAVLDLGVASLDDVLAILPGEVIRTSVPVDAPLQVRLPDGRPVFSGALLAENGQRALRCTDIT